jgi:hypothetical protein
MVEVGVAMAEVYLLFARSFFPNFMMSWEKRGGGGGALSAGIPENEAQEDAGELT